MNPIKSTVNLSWNNKCSCYQFSLPARVSCPGVAERMKNPMCVCHFCYACNSLWNMGAAKKFIQHNLTWVQRTVSHIDMTLGFLDAFDQIPNKYRDYFRWFGSGDVLTEALGETILHVADLRPNTKFWLPTHNVEFWKTRGQDCPDNLNITLSRDVMNEPAREFGTTVVSGDTPKDHVRCPGECKKCRICWLSSGFKVAFPFHGSAITVTKYNKARRRDEKNAGGV